MKKIFVITFSFCFSKKQEIILGNYKLKVSHDYTLVWSPGTKNPDWPMTGANIIQESDNDFIIVGTGAVVTFTINNSDNKSVEILQADEGVYKDGKWIPRRRMNGDLYNQGRHIRIPVDEWGIQKMKLYQYK